MSSRDIGAVAASFDSQRHQVRSSQGFGPSRMSLVFIPLLVDGLIRGLLTLDGAFWGNSKELVIDSASLLSLGCKTWGVTNSLITLRLEQNLTPELLLILIPPLPESVVSSIDLPRL